MIGPTLTPSTIRRGLKLDLAQEIHSKISFLSPVDLVGTDFSDCKLPFILKTQLRLIGGSY